MGDVSCRKTANRALRSSGVEEQLMLGKLNSLVGGIYYSLSAFFQSFLKLWKELA